MGHARQLRSVQVYYQTRAGCVLYVHQERWDTRTDGITT